MGYFAQGHETLDLDATPLDLVRAARPYYENQAVALLGKFLFTYEQVRQPVRTLSGGERSRLACLLLMLGNANCLVLDEPTNHLDIDSAEALEAALEDFRRHSCRHLARSLLPGPYHRPYRGGTRR